jgi:hypothetical protein
MNKMNGQLLVTRTLGSPFFRRRLPDYEDFAATILKAKLDGKIWTAEPSPAPKVPEKRAKCKCAVCGQEFLGWKTTNKSCGRKCLNALRKMSKSCTGLTNSAEKNTTTVDKESF